MTKVILASRSSARASLLSGAGVVFATAGSGVDEDAIKTAMLQERATPREIADALAEMKAVKVSRRLDGLVIGADQTLELDGRLFDKAETVEEAEARLKLLRGRTHSLHSAVVVAQGGQPIWREVASARLTMRSFSDPYLQGYIERQGPEVLSSVGCYQLEAAGLQLFEKIDGDYFSILGLPMIGLLDLLRRHGALET